MSKFRVRAIWNSAIRTIELSRANYSFNELRDEVRVKFEVKEFQLRYHSPSVGEVFVQDDVSLKKVVKDSEVRGNHQVEVRIITRENPPASLKGSGGYTPPQQKSAPSSSYSAPAQQTYSPPAYTPPAYNPSSGGGNVAVAASGSTIASFTVGGDRNSSAEKLTMKANQEDDHFAFIPQPAKFPSEVTASLDATKLTFESITNTADGRTFKFTQAFNLPFTPNRSKTRVDGTVLKLYFA